MSFFPSFPSRRRASTKNVCAEASSVHRRRRFAAARRARARRDIRHSQEMCTRVPCRHSCRHRRGHRRENRQVPHGQTDADGRTIETGTQRVRRARPYFGNDDDDNGEGFRAEPGCTAIPTDGGAAAAANGILHGRSVALDNIVRNVDVVCDTPAATSVTAPGIHAKDCGDAVQGSCRTRCCVVSKKKTTSSPDRKVCPSAFVRSVGRSVGRSEKKHGLFVRYILIPLNSAYALSKALFSSAKLTTRSVPPSRLMSVTSSSKPASSLLRDSAT